MDIYQVYRLEKSKFANPGKARFSGVYATGKTL